MSSREKFEPAEQQAKDYLARAGIAILPEETNPARAASHGLITLRTQIYRRDAELAESSFKFFRVLSISAVQE
jgi:hypothetical protein